MFTNNRNFVPRRAAAGSAAALRAAHRSALRALAALRAAMGTELRKVSGRFRKLSNQFEVRVEFPNTFEVSGPKIFNPRSGI